MVRLDDVRLAALVARTLNDIRVDRSLGKVFHVFEFCRFLVENINKGVTDDLALLLRILNVLELLEEPLLSVNTNDVEAERVVGIGTERPDHFISLAEAQQAVVHKHTGQLIANCPRQQRSYN